MLRAALSRTTVGPGGVINLSPSGSREPGTEPPSQAALLFEGQFRIALNRALAYPQGEVGNVARTATWRKPGRIPRTASQVTAVVVGLFLSAGLRADEPLQAEIDFKPVYSLPVVDLATSQGKIRLVVDTASNFTSLLRAPSASRSGWPVRRYGCDRPDSDS